MSSTFVYNLSIKVAWPIAKEWLKWQKEEHIPEIMSTGQFDNYRIYKLQEAEDIEGPTFILQFFSESEAAYRIYQAEFASGLLQKAFQKWGDQFIAHRSTMTLVH